MKLPRISAVFRLITPLLGLFALVLSAQAQSFYWNVSSGLWPVVGNWVDGSNAAVTQLGGNVGAGDYFLTNGTLVAPATTTMTGIPNPRFFNSLQVGQYNTLFLTGTADSQNAGTPRLTSLLTNAGLIQAGSAANDFLRVELNSTGTNVNSNEIRAAQGLFRLVINNGGSLNNAGGLMLVKTGATLNLSTGTGSIQAGTLRSETNSTIEVGGYDVQTKVRLSGVTVENNGTFRTTQSTGGSGARTLNTLLLGNSTFANVGTTLVLSSGTGANTGTIHDSRFDVDSTASFTNTGTIRVLNDSTKTGNTGYSQTATFAVSATTATFTSTGTIEVFNESALANTFSRFTSVKAIVNQGKVHLRGNAANLGASFVLTGTSDNGIYSQTGATSRTLLERGALLTAPTITITEGRLGGVGTITGATTIGSDATLIAGDTLASGPGAGQLAFSGSLTFLANSEVQFGLGANTANSGRFSLLGSSALTVGTDVTLSLFDLGSATSGTYRLFALDSGTITGGFILDQVPAGWTAELSGGAGFNYVDVTLAPIPEPSTYALLAAGGTGLAAMVIRRRRGRAA